MRALVKSGQKTEVSTRDKYDRNARWYDVAEFLSEVFLYVPWRRLLFKKLGNWELLELGVGTGKNLKWYPKGVNATAIDFSEKMLEHAKRRAVKAGQSIDLRHMDVQKLEFKKNSFSNILATFVFCSVPDPIKGLQEVRRVATPGAQFLLLEHVRPKNKALGRLFDWLNPMIVNRTGVNINRRTVDNIRQAGFQIELEKNLFFGIFKLITARPRADTPHL